MAFGFGYRRAFGLAGGGSVLRKIKWLLSLNTNLIATVGPSATKNVGSVTQARVWDATTGLKIEEVPAGVAVSEGERISYDTDEAGVTLGDDLVDTMNTAAAWVAFGTNTVEDDSSEVKITYVDNSNGARTQLAVGLGLTTNLTIGETYNLTGMARVNSGSTVEIRTQNFGGLLAEEQIITSITKVPFSLDITATTTTAETFQTKNMGTGEIIWISDMVFKKITPTFKNSVSKSDSTKLHPTKTGTQGEDVFIVHQAWPGAAQSVDANSYAVGKNGNHWYYFQADSGGGTTGGSEPTWPDTLDATVVDNDITWTNKGRYSNIGPGYLPHIFSVPTEQTQYLLNSDAPETQTTGSLANGDYVLWQNGAGSSDLTAGTATISTTGSATDSSPLTFSVTSPGTVTVTIVGGPPDEFQLENGDFPTVFILSAGSTVVRDADDFSSAAIPETGKMRWRLALENLGAQTIVSDGTNTLSYSGTAIEFTDGVTTLSHIVVPVHGDFVGLAEETGTLYYNASSVDVDGALDVTWGAITDMNNVVDITDDSDLDLTDDTWNLP